MSRYVIVPQRDTFKGRPEAEGTWFQECGEDEAALWAVIDTHLEDILEDHSTRSHAEEHLRLLRGE